MTMTKPREKLTPKEARFVDEYLKDPDDASRCAARAGYSPAAAKQAAHKLLNRPRVAAAIGVVRAERCKRTMIDADWLLRRLAEEATADVGDLYDENGAIKPLHSWPRIWRTGLVEGMTVAQKVKIVDGKKKSAGKVTKIKLSDRVKRLDLIGKHIDVQAFSDKHVVEHDLTKTMMDIVHGAAGTTRSLPSEVD